MAGYEAKAETYDEEEGEDHKALTYSELMVADNIVDLLDEEELGEISARVREEYELDEASRSEWLKTNKEAIKLAMMVSEEKTYPLAVSSNVKYPLIASAALQFNARAYPAICPPDRVVKGKTYGHDPDGKKSARADRISEHMSWQLMSQLTEWEEDTDRLTVILPIVGCAFRKVFYDPSLGRKVTRLVTAERMVYNYWARSFNDLPRITELMSLYPYEIRERINDGRFAEFDYSALDKGDTPEHGHGLQDDDDGPHMFLEQHRLLDLDDDGYPEPYVVTVHKSSGKVCRIKANWSADTAQVKVEGEAVKVISLRRQNYFVRYLFLPAPDGGAYGLGFGWLLASTNDSINTVLNQTFDAAHLANIQGGFISANLGPKMKNRDFKFQQGEWKIINTNGPLREAMVPMDYKGPSPVLMTLLEFLINSGEKLASIKDVLTGDTPTTAPVGTTAMLIDQGLQVFVSIYKRVYRGLKEEFKLHAALNEKHVTPEEYQRFFDDPSVDPQADYDAKDLDVEPVSDPQSVTKAQKVAKAQAIMGIATENPSIDIREATKRMLEAIDAEDIEKLMPPPPPPDPEQAALLKRAATAEVAEKEANAEDKIASATAKLAAAIKSIADAEGVEAGQQMQWYAQVVDMLKTEHSMENDIVGQANGGQGGVPGMAGQPGDPMGVGAPPVGGNGLGPEPAGDASGAMLPPPGGMDAGAAPSSPNQGVL